MDPGKNKAAAEA